MYFLLLLTVSRRCVKLRALGRLKPALVWCCLDLQSFCFTERKGGRGGERKRESERERENEAIEVIVPQMTTLLFTYIMQFDMLMMMMMMKRELIPNFMNLFPDLTTNIVH